MTAAARKPKPAKPAAPGALTIEYVPTGGLQRYGRNARTHSDSQVSQIAESIRAFGFTNPLLIDEDREIIAGHGRLLAALHLGLPSVPTITLAGLSPAQRRALRIADNQLALNAGWDDALLREELGGLTIDGFDLGLLGFADDELAALLGAAGAAGAEPDHANLADRFGVPPFTVLSARDGWWQDRKRAWIALGIQSELGRGENLQGLWDANATPGGSNMPAADYSKRQLGDGRGRAIQGGPATSTLGAIPPKEGDIMGRKGKYAAKAKA